MHSKELAKLVDFGARRILATPGVTLSSMLDSPLVCGCDDTIPNYLPIMKGWIYTVRLYRPCAEILKRLDFPRGSARELSSHRLAWRLPDSACKRW
jgi:hypothetical protein